MGALGCRPSLGVSCSQVGTGLPVTWAPGWVCTRHACVCSHVPVSLFGCMSVGACDSCAHQCPCESLESVHWCKECLHTWRGAVYTRGGCVYTGEGAVYKTGGAVYRQWGCYTGLWVHHGLCRQVGACTWKGSRTQGVPPALHLGVCLGSVYLHLCT